MSHTLSRLPSPLGDLLAITAADGTLHALDFADFTDRLHRLFARHHPGAALAEGPAPAALTAAVTAYFAGDLAALDALPLAGIGSEFQRRVWAALRRIPAGETRSYGQLAASIGQPAASRAVGLANGANPIGIAVPCHRVIGSGGALTGYAGGVERKAWLLRHEGALAPLLA
ncbi:methylated-DNA--[protein]-cysteine S-methyltransferase [Sandarakinorhabdus sp.]|uniref:methylated-DNA--[protein]-cysteine S-methyltransferase n=1 Tax=Sandarakinorhabdus sp. TaxID=1916663 RepID=UPI0035676052